MAELVPVNNKIIVTKYEQESTSTIFIPDSANRSQLKLGKVVSASLSKEYGISNYKTDTIVVFHKDVGFEIEFDGEKFTILDEGQILAVVK